MAVRFSIWETSEEKATLTINKKEKDIIENSRKTKEHTLYSGANKRFYVTSTYSGIPHVIMEFTDENKAKEEFITRVDKVYEEV